MVGIRLARSPPEIHQSWIGDDLPSATIIDAWVGTGEVFGELGIQDTVMEEVDTAIEDFGKEIEKQEKLTQPVNTPQKKITIYRGKQYP